MHIESSKDTEFLTTAFTTAKEQIDIFKVLYPKKVLVAICDSLNS